MITDARLLVSDAQAVTTTAVSTDAIPLNVVGRDVGNGEPMGFQIGIDVAALVAGTETYDFQIVTATASNLTSGQTIIASKPFTTAQAAALTAGARFFLPLPANLIPATATHIGLRYATANSAGVTVTASMMPQSFFDDNNTPLRSGFEVAA